MSSARSTVSAKLSNFAHRLGFKQTLPAAFRQKVAQLELSFPTFCPLNDSIWWHSTPSLERLFELPLGALSGPVQEDKAHAHKALGALVERQQIELEAVDLRSLDGLLGHSQEQQAFSSLEHYSAAKSRHVRIISYNDFQKTLQQVLGNQPLVFNEASWRGSRRFWNETQHIPAFASLVSYARLRKLCIERKALVNSYQLSAAGIARLQSQFHVLCMPNMAWSHEPFMALLLRNQLPYSRLTLQRGTGACDCLILPKDHPRAHYLGKGLLALGAQDLSQYLTDLPVS